MLKRLNKNKKVYPPNRQGFSIMESIIGIAIVSGVFVAFLALLPSIIKTESHAQRTIIATNLAQEGVEMIRNLRDNNLKIGCDAFDNPDVAGCIFPYYPNEGVDVGWVSVYDWDEEIYKPYTNPVGTDNDHDDYPGFARSFVLGDLSDGAIDVTVSVKYNEKLMAELTTTLYSWGEKN